MNKRVVLLTVLAALAGCGGSAPPPPPPPVLVPPITLAWANDGNPSLPVCVATMQPNGCKKSYTITDPADGITFTDLLVLTNTSYTLTPASTAQHTYYVMVNGVTPAGIAVQSKPLVLVK